MNKIIERVCFYTDSCIDRAACFGPVMVVLVILEGCYNARWLSMPRVEFLLKAGADGAVMLDDNEDDFRRESSLL